MTATVRHDRSDGESRWADAPAAWHDGVLAVGTQLSPEAETLVVAAGPSAGDDLVPVVLDLVSTPADAVGDLVDVVTLALAERTPDDRAVLLLAPGAADADPTSSGSVAARLAAVSGRTVIAASTRVAAHPQGGLTALDDGRFASTDGTDLGMLFPRPEWAEHVPAQSAFVGEAGLLDPVPAGVWIHADPSARSPQQRLGGLVHGVPPVPLWPVIVLGTPGGPALDLDAVAAALTARRALLERAVVVPFGVTLTELRALADRLGHGFDAVTAMVVTSETGAAVVRTVGRDARFGWTPLVSRIRLEPGHAAPVATVSRSPVRVEDLGGDTADIRLDVVPAGLWLRTSASDTSGAAGVDNVDDPRTVDVDLDGVRLFVGDPGRPTPTSLVQRAAALLGRLDPALRQGARIVMVGAAADASPRSPGQAAPDPTEPAAPPPVDGPPPTAPPEPTAAPSAPLVHPAGSASELDRMRVREALGAVYGRLGGRTSVVLALEPGRGLGDGSARDDLVALVAVLAHASDADPRLHDALTGAFDRPDARTALLLCAAAGADSLATHRGIAFATLSVPTLPDVDDVLPTPPFARLAPTRPADPGAVVLAVRSRTVRRLGGLLTADAGGALIAPPGLRVRVRAIVEDTGTGTLVLADEVADESTDGRSGSDPVWFDGRSDADDEAPALPSWPAG